MCAEDVKERPVKSEMGDVGDKPEDCRLDDVLDGVKLEGEGCRDNGETED